jgi:ubiquinone/menaquinone biosynthesis C-methylase UbiE
MARRMRFRSTMRSSLDGAGWVLQQLVDPVRALGEMVCVTRPCGRVVVADLDQESLMIEVPGVPADLVTG